MDHTVLFLPEGISVKVKKNTTILRSQILAGLQPDAPCGGKGTCGKCRVWLDGQKILACQALVDRDLTVTTRPEEKTAILATGLHTQTAPDGSDDYCLAFDIGTTTVVAYLIDGHTGSLLAQSSAVNPQSQFGADVISRIQHALKEGSAALSGCIRSTMEVLTGEVCVQAGILPSAIGRAALVGNTAMHHLLLGIDPKPLVTPPYMPKVSEAQELGIARILPNIAGFVGGDTVGCMVATRFDKQKEPTLLMDIGTNGEMVLGNSHRRIACSTAAGPAFEGANISCGMRGSQGAVDHVKCENGEITYHVIGDCAPRGICGSGLVDLVAVLLDTGILDKSGRMKEKQYRLCDNVVLTQKDVRQVQLAKAAIRAGIELLAEQMGVSVADIQKVYLAGAFGNYMNPLSACRIGMIPPVLQDRIVPIGNAAGEGARLCAISRGEFEYSKQLSGETEFLELASLPQFRNRYVDALDFPESEKG